MSPDAVSCNGSGTVRTIVGTQQKALDLNLDPEVYGTLAEIGAGQEVARWFFQAGRAANTVAKSISAYDMAVSDAIYGKCDRYVSRRRLEAMLECEYAVLHDQLGAARADKSRFFVFADTVATRRYGRSEPGNGWLGVRFQTAPLGPPSEVIIHVVMRDSERPREQEALGTIGVNLVHGAVNHHAAPATLIDSLMDGLGRERVEIDMIRFAGPAFAGVDNRSMCLKLVERKFTDAVMFTADGEVVQPSELLYQRPVLVERGRFRPVTLLNVDILDRALAQFRVEPEVAGEEPIVLMEMTLCSLRSEEEIDDQDFLARVDVLRSLGRNVMISNHGPYYQLAEHLARSTQKPIGIALGIPALSGIMSEQHYRELPGRALEAVGRLFTRSVRVYLYPCLAPGSSSPLTAESLPIAPHFRHLYAHLLENRHVVPIREYTMPCLAIDADRVLREIRAGDPAWEAAVPSVVAETIKRHRLFGWSPG
jgi:hypothetical protein